jgi:ATP-binding cassette subfamily C exporter for protease/lipase
MRRPDWLSRSDLGRALWTFRREFAWVGFFSLFANLLLLTPTLYMLQVFDRVMISRSELTLLAVTIIALSFLALMAFSEWLRSQLLVRAGVRFDEFLNSRVFVASFEANLNRSGSTEVRAFADLTNLRQFLTGNGVFAFFDVPWTPIYLLVIFLMHPTLGWVSVAFFLLLAGMAWLGYRVTAPHTERVTDTLVDANTFLTTKMRNAEAVQAMGMLGNLRARWMSLHQRSVAAQTDSHDATHRMQALTKFVQYSQQSIVLAAGAWLVIHGEMTAGAMIASNVLMSNALRPVSMMVLTWRQFIEARAAYGRLETLLEAHPVREGGHSAEEVQGQITLKGLVAKAPGREQPILKGLDARFEAGEVIGIVGPSGAGKSTLARCLIGIWPQTDGEVLLDGIRVDQWSREVLGPRIGYLPQDIELFEGSIAENIARFGEVDSKRVIEAAQRTGIHEMVLRMPKGYDTPMGVAGSLMSGGQRQRIGLARAIYGDPAVVVLDEPNANLDDAGVAALGRAIVESKSRGATVFMIVHQRNLLAVADRVLVLNDGVITQFGPMAQARTTSE